MNLKTEAQSWGLSSDEFDRICQSLGREPNRTELGIFAVMWSEHCSYKSTRVHLKKLPTKAKQVIEGPGENAGVVALDDTYVAAFKIESHNHPSFIEPFQGAATGVGGILRDIFTMGARPVALLNSLAFGEPKQPRMPYLVHGVVSGISEYGNCMGIPTVGGECHFDASYNGNILVNAMAVGIAKKDGIFKGKAQGAGECVIYLGSPTGKDGIHGATMASEEFDAESEAKRPTVQVGDPFMEKILLEACMEIMAERLVSGIQDMGAAGLACSTFEMADRGDAGMDVTLDHVPLRQPNLTPYDMFLSESQERMLLVAPEANVARIKAIAAKWDVPCAVIGHVTHSGRVRATFRGATVVDLPVKPVTQEAPVYERPYVSPKISTATLGEESLSHVTLEDLLKTWLTHPNLSSRAWIYRQFDSHVGNDSVVPPGHDAAVMRVKGSKAQIALAVDSRALWCQADPHAGIGHVVCEVMRNLACVGARPLGLSNCLNFGSPEIPEVMGQIVASIEGLGSICRALDIPVTGGNVSLYNTSQDQSIKPTPTIALLGTRPESTPVVPATFQGVGDEVWVLGKLPDQVYSSILAQTVLGREDLACPSLDVRQERALCDALIALVQSGHLRSVHDCSEGGLMQALIESCAQHEGQILGVAVEWPKAWPQKVGLFGEIGASAVVSIAPSSRNQVEEILRHRGVEGHSIGTVQEGRLSVGSELSYDVGDILAMRKRFFEEL